MERLVAAYRAAGLRVAVVAVDPTSPFTGGALLGDRIRMESVALDQGVYIRSHGQPRLARRARHQHPRGVRPARCRGVRRASSSRRSASGSRSSTSPRMADSTVLVLVPESGDGIQTLKSGVMEAADLFVVNKSRPAGRRQAAPGDRGDARHPAGERVSERPGASRTAGWPRASTAGGSGTGALGASRRPDDRRQGRGRRGAGRRARSTPRVAGAERRRSRSAGAGACGTGPARSWIVPRRSGSGRKRARTQMIAERLDEVVDGRLSPYRAGRRGAGRAQTR